MREKTYNIGISNKKLTSLLKLYKAKRIGVFGSCVNGNFHKGSDVDILVEFKKNADLMDQAGLQLELQELLARRVDLVTPNSLNKYIRNRILKEVVYL